MTKTPDRIKKGLACCAASIYQCEDDCPYREECRNGQGGKAVMEDALALIQRLQEKNEAMHEEIVRLQAERDAMKALFDFPNDLCAICKHEAVDDDVCRKVDYCCSLCTDDCACHQCMDASRYEWRGVQKGETP